MDEGFSPRDTTAFRFSTLKHGTLFRLTGDACQNSRQAIQGMSSERASMRRGTRKGGCTPYGCIRLGNAGRKGQASVPAWQTHNQQSCGQVLNHTAHRGRKQEKPAMLYRAFPQKPLDTNTSTAGGTILGRSGTTASPTHRGLWVAHKRVLE